MIGVDPLHSGRASFQATFASAVHFSGRFVSLLTPFRRGPRHCGQFSAFSEASDNAANSSETRMRAMQAQSIKRRNGDRGIARNTDLNQHHSQSRCECTWLKTGEGRKENTKFGSSLLHSPVDLSRHDRSVTAAGGVEPAMARTRERQT